MTYRPNPPTTAEDLVRYITDELERIGDSFEAIDTESVRWAVFNAAPDKPQAGQVYYADGTDWNPGGTGEGLYFYTSGAAWVKL